jgi:hypothetical protein
MLNNIASNKNKNCTCHKKQNAVAPRRRFPFLLSLVIAILPKCPFCIFGYTSVMTMCSGTALSTHTQGNIFAYLPLCLAILVILSFFLNFKGQKTFWALGLALAGTACVTWSSLFSGNLTAYFGGAVLIFLSVFMNGSLLFFLNKFKQKFA